jgi:predicted nucleic acid-binding protein
MKDRIFLDTSLFVYSFDRSAPAKAKRARDLIAAAVGGRNGIVSYQVVQEFLSAALKRFERPMKPPEAEQYLTSVFRPLLSVYASQGLFLEALRLCGRYRLGWYDSLIVAAAIEGQCSVLYSEDLQDGMRIGELVVKNPFL